MDVRELKQVLSKWQYILADRGWNALYFENHDRARIVSRWGNDGKYRVERILANGSGEKFEIYDTYDDATKPANAHGRIEDALKSRVNELTLEIKYATEDIQRLKASHLAEMNALKLKWDEDKDKHARERIKLGDEYATLLRKFELEEEKLKVLRDHQLHSMKVSGESTRYIFTTIAAIIGLIPLLMKFTAK